MTARPEYSESRIYLVANAVYCRTSNLYHIYEIAMYLNPNIWVILIKVIPRWSLHEYHTAISSTVLVTYVFWPNNFNNIHLTSFSPPYWLKAKFTKIIHQ